MLRFRSKLFIVLTITSMGCDRALAQNADIIPLVEIPAGSYYMGSNGEGENFDEAPVHKVYITHPFKMGRTEVTNAQYEMFRPEHRKLRGIRQRRASSIVCLLRLSGSMPAVQVHTPYIIQAMGCRHQCVAIR